MKLCEFFWMKMLVWVYKILLSFWFCSFLLLFLSIFFKNVFMNTWNFVNFMNENAFMNVWNFMNFLNENVCLNAWIFPFSWMIMHILKHKILFFTFIFLNDNAWNSIFLYVQIFKWFYKWWFFSVNFSKTMFQKDMYEFSKREDMYKRYFQLFSNVWRFMSKGIFFNDFFQCLFKKSIQRFFQIYIFYVHSKRIFSMIFFKCIYTKNLKYLKNMYKIFFSFFLNFTM